VRQSAERLESEWIELRATQPERGDEVEAEEVAAMRPEGRPLPAGCLELGQDREEAEDAVAVDGIEYEDVAIRAETAVAAKQVRLGGREERLPGSQRRVIRGGERRESLEVVRVAHIFEPAKPVRGERARRLDPARASPGVHCIHGEAPGVANDAQHHVDPAEILGDRGRADLDLYHLVTKLHERAGLVLEHSQVVGGIAK